MENIIEILKDDKEYYGGVGKKYLSNSNIYNLLKNPKAFGLSQDDSKELLFGRHFHHLILEPEKAKDVEYVDVKSRVSKAYKEYVAENNSGMVMLKHEVEHAERLVKAMMGNEYFRDLIMDDFNEYEVPAIGEIEGALWKGKADIVGTDCLYDLKTSSDIGRFKYKVNDYNYDSQAYIYQELFGKPLVFLVIDKTSEMLGEYTVSEDTLDRGRRKVAKAVEVYNKFFSEKATLDINQYFFNEEV